MVPPLIETRHLFFAYDEQQWILNDVSLSLQEGGFYSISGPSGSGKSTLLRLFCRLEEPKKGTIQYRGKPLSTYQPQQLRKSVCYIQQSPVLTGGTVKDNLLLPFTFSANKKTPIPAHSRLLQSLSDCGLNNVALDHPAKGLSQGQKQRLCMLRALLMEPEVLLLDEPVSALDEESADRIFTLIDKVHHERKVTIVLVSHVGLDRLRSSLTRIPVDDFGGKQT